MSAGNLDASMALARHQMVRTQIEARGITDPRVLATLRRVPRHVFVPEAYRIQAHEDHPLPLGFGQTISQPYIVALMAAELQLQGHERVLEIGSGCGYMAAVLSQLAADVFGIEREQALCQQAQATLEGLPFTNIHLRWGDGALGWEEQAPFDAMVISCATEHIPPLLWDQLAPEGRIVLPVGSPFGYQELQVVTRTDAGLSARPLGAVAFVPMRSGTAC